MKTVNEVSKLTGVNIMDFKAFDTTKLDEYARQAKEAWGHTEAYKEYEERCKTKSSGDMNDAAFGLMSIFAEFGKMYAAGGSMTENIDKAGGKGTAEFAARAIEVYCKNN